MSKKNDESIEPVEDKTSDNKSVTIPDLLETRGEYAVLDTSQIQQIALVEILHEVEAVGFVLLSIFSRSSMPPVLIFRKS